MGSLTVRGASVLVAGGTGFVGSHLVRRLTALGARVHVMARQSSSLERLAGLQPAPALTRVGLDDQAAIGACVRKVRPDIVFLAAGSTSERDSNVSVTGVGSTFEINIGATCRLLHAVLSEAPGARVIRIGSIAEYGAGAVPFKEGQREQPDSPYAASLVAATHLAQSLHRQTGMAITTLRLALTYGPAQSEDFLIPSLITACIDGRPFTLKHPAHTRDLVYVGDAVDALLAAAVADGVAGEVLNIGAGREHPVGEVAALIVRLAGGDPGLLSEEPTPTGTGLSRLVFDPQQARELLGWQSQTTLEEGLERTIAAYRASRMS